MAWNIAAAVLRRGKLDSKLGLRVPQTHEAAEHEADRGYEVFSSIYARNVGIYADFFPAAQPNLPAIWVEAIRPAA